MKYIVVIFLLLGCHLSNSQSGGCEKLRSPVGFIHKFERLSSETIRFCWIIPVPTGKMIQLKMTNLTLKWDCSKTYVQVSFEEEETHKFCGVSHNARTITALSDTTVTFRKQIYWFSSEMNGFHLEYIIRDSECISKESFKCTNTSCISQARVCDGRMDCENAADEIGCGDNEGSPQVELCDGRKDCGSGAGEIGSGDIECIDEDSFRCSSTSCIPQAEVCDGRKDCDNGADEIGCGRKKTGVLAIPGVAEARKKAVSWLKKERLSSWGWRDYTPRGVVALYLASDATFNGTALEEELMAKETEIKIAVALLRPSLTNSELSMFIHALLATCHNPRDFYGNNLVKRLKEQVENSQNVSHPISYLALCNAHESWPPMKADADLKAILNSSLEYPFVKDLQAMAILALSCKANSTENSLTSTTSRLYKHTSEKLKTSQMQDGSFGNLHTTALITQALISIGQENSKDWKLNATVQYLMKELNSPSVDFLSVYLALPILSGKTLTDVYKVNCSAHARIHADDPVSKVNEFLGPKMRVRYTLVIGDEKDVIHTISLRVPENYTAFQTMQLAEIEDQKYKFYWKMISGKMYVYKIANISNDPETGKFWLLYVVSNGEAEIWTHYAAGPDEVVLKDNQELVFWFKTASI